MEEWRPVPGHEGCYEVSSHGQVRSVERDLTYHRPGVGTIARHHAGRVLRPGRKPSGHLSVALGRGNSRDIHVLVLQTFVGPCPDGLECRHLDDDPSNNRLPNLLWGTRSENLHDAVRNGKKRIGERHPRAKLTADQARRVKYGTERPCDLGREFGVNEATIREIRSGRNWRHV